MACSPAEDYMRVGALEGKAADAGRGVPSGKRRAAELAGEMDRCAGPSGGL